MDSNEGIVLRTRFRRVMSLEAYNTQEAEVMVEQAFPTGDMSPEDIQAHVAGMFMYAKASVYDQLGLGYEQDDATGIIMEKFKGTKVVSAPPAQNAQPAARAAAPKALRPVPNEPEPSDEEYDDQADAMAAEEAPAPRKTFQRTANRSSAKASGGVDYWDHLMNNPDRWFDNRLSKKNPKAPDFRSKDYKEGNFAVGLWLNQAPDGFVNPFD